jgi:hypothetical protein
MHCNMCTCITYDSIRQTLNSDILKVERYALNRIFNRSHSTFSRPVRTPKLTFMSKFIIVREFFISQLQEQSMKD